jgi:fucose permease
MGVLQISTVCTLLVTGMGIALLGSVKVPLARKLEIDEARVGGLISIFGLAMIPVMLAAGFLTDLINKQAVLTVGALLMVGGLILLARAKKYGLALLAVLLLSIAWSAQINVVNVIQFKAFEGDTAHVTNLANFFFGLGAFLTPLVVALLLRRAGFSPAMFALAAFVTLSAVLIMCVDFGALYPVVPKLADRPAVPGIGILLGDPIMWLAAMAMFFFAPVEVGVSTWITTYLDENGVSEKLAAVLLSAFWLVYTFARLTAAFALPAGSERVFIVAAGLASIAILAAMVFGRNRNLAIAMVVLAGIVFGPTFPTIIAVLLGHFEPSLHGRAVGLFFAIGGVGWTIIPMAIGAYAKRTSIQRGFLMAMLSAVGLTVVAVALLFTQ